MKNSMLFAFVLAFCFSAFSQSKDSLRVNLLVNAPKMQVKINGRNQGDVKSIMLAPGKNRISIYTPYVGVFDTILEVNDKLKPNLMVNFPAPPGYREDLNRRSWRILKKTSLLVTGVAIVPVSLFNVIAKRKSYMLNYDILNKSPKVYDEARSPQEVVSAENYIKGCKEKFAQTKADYRKACISAGVTTAISGVLIFWGLKTKIPVLQDRAILLFDAISINQSTVVPGINLIVSL